MIFTWNRQFLPWMFLSYSEFRMISSSPREVGTYQCVTVGVFVIINEWPAGTFRLAVLGTGVGGYQTKCVYDIEVAPSKRRLLDISSFRKEPDSAPDPLNIMGKWTDPKATI